MAYLGNDLQVAYQSYKNIDDISSSFNGITTSFALLVNGSAPSPLPINSQQCFISVGGVLQRPDDTGAEGFRLSGGNIIFSSAPASGEDFFGVILAGADYVNVGANFPDGSVGAPSITFDQNNNTGFYRPGSGQISFSSDGVNAATFGLNSFTARSFTPTGSTVPTNGFYLPSANSVAISTNGTQRATVDSSGRLLVGTSTGRNIADAAQAGIQYETTNFGGISITNNRGDTSGANLAFGKQRSGSVGGNTIVQNGDGLGAILFGGADGTDLETQGARIEAAVDGTPGANDMPGRIVLSTTSDGASSPTERMRIDSSGRLLVGISSATTSRVYIQGTTGNSTYSVNGLDVAVGGDTSNPNGRGVVAAFIAGGISDPATTYGATINIGASSVGQYGIRIIPGTSFVISDYYPGGTYVGAANPPTDRMRITGNGGFKVTTSGSYVIGSSDSSHEIIQSTAGIAALHALHTASSGTPYGIYCKFTQQNPNNTTSYVLTSLDNTGANIYTIYSNGTVTARSDAKFKKNIQTTRDGYLEDLAKLRVVKYNWYNHDDRAPKELGFIAQEVEQVFPALVSTIPDKDNRGNETGTVSKNIKTSVFTPMLVKALQEALERIKTLEAKVAALKSS